MALRLGEGSMREIQQHGTADYPHECCGFLVGKTDAGDSRVSEIRPATNTRDDLPRNRFEIDPAELFRVDRAARKKGLGVVGFYHSHPDAPAVPSRFDRERAWAGYSYLIVSVVQGEPAEMNSWQLSADGSEFEPEEIRIETDA